jgi:dephospho-CoA kinase
MIKIALTGSIATGKSYVLKIFSEFLIPVFSFDDEVAKLLKEDKKILVLVEAFLPEVVESGVINRKSLSDLAFSKKEVLNELENILYPRLLEEYELFLRKSYAKNTAVIVAEAPLLFEKQLEDKFDKIVLTTCSESDRIERALRRQGMTIEKLNAILENQIADSKKEKLADFVISTSDKFSNIKRQVSKIIKSLGNERNNTRY